MVCPFRAGLGGVSRFWAYEHTFSETVTSAPALRPNARSTYNFRATGILETSHHNYSNPFSLQLGRIELDVYGPNGTYLGPGNLTIGQLPDASQGQSELTALIDTEANSALTNIWGDQVLPWYLRPTGVFGWTTKSAAAGQADIEEFENLYLTQALAGMEWRVDVSTFENI
ncbi:hypothetical protein MPH_02300 [Macrophomina phaseolina MS6]|uniref:Uncharacterized protein n=2 Tax=Macrophomina phaseolina TaxID=35725 RepID=K2SUK7_MACPH|nr:hypothetical protein MPH_02300 [Macrophomina phaseolina MS6]